MEREKGTFEIENSTFRVEKGASEGEKARSEVQKAPSEQEKDTSKILNIFSYIFFAQHPPHAPGSGLALNQPELPCGPRYGYNEL